MDYTKLDFVQARQALNSGEVTSVELTRQCLRRAKETHRLNAFVSLNEQHALEQAKRADELLKSGNGGALCGIPISVKDNFQTTDFPTTCASAILEGFVPQEDAFVVTLLRNAGAVIVGKNNMDEFAMGSTSMTSAYGKVYNPYNVLHVPGGSSGGSAVSVAVGSSFVSIGSDTGGSIRQPAAFCGVVGFKPSYGRLSRRGLFPLAPTLDHGGIFGRSVADVASVLAVIGVHDPLDDTSADLPPVKAEDCLKAPDTTRKIAYLKQSFDDLVDPEIRKNFEHCLQLFRKNGFSVEELDFPFTAMISGIYTILNCTEGVNSLKKIDGVHLGKAALTNGTSEEIAVASRTKYLGFNVRKRLLSGAAILQGENYENEYITTLRWRKRISDFMKESFQQYACILSPTTATPATLMEGETRQASIDFSDVFAVIANLVGLPAVSVPCGRTQEGLPMGLQLMAKRFDEETLLRYAHWFERRTKEGQEGTIQ